MVDGYTFYEHKKASKTSVYSCTGARNCKARLKMTRAVNVEERILVDAKTEHCHVRPSYVIRDGFYVKT